MGFMSRRVLPVCGNMCVCCPGLRSRSRQPVKRYKKLFSDIFPKNHEELPNDRKIAKLADYAAKNPLRIPKIAALLEQRGSKELRSEHYGSVRVIMTAYCRLLISCKEQMTLFAISLLSMIHMLFDQTENEEMQILACHALKDFIYSQVDGTYTHNLNGMMCKICELVREKREQDGSQRLRAAGLQTLAAMIWFMSQRSHISGDFDNIVYAILENYGSQIDDQEHSPEGGDLHHTWVDEVRRCEGRGAVGIVKDSRYSFDTENIKLRFKDPSKLTREEMETPKVWALQCIHNLVQLAKETSTVRRVLEPVFQYFDEKHWTVEQGMALPVLRDMSYLMQSTGNEEMLLSALVRHLDHKSIAHHTQKKTDIVRIVAILARQTRPKATLNEVSVISDLCKHLRKSIQATMEAANQQEINSNMSLKSYIEECLLESVKRVSTAESIYTLIAMTLEKLSTVIVIARATVRAMLILSQIVAYVVNPSNLQQGFPDALFHQLLQAMVHQDSETRVVAHQIFSMILLPSFVSLRNENRSLLFGSNYEQWRVPSKFLSVFASGSELFEKLRKEKSCFHDERVGSASSYETKEREGIEEEWWQDRYFRSPTRVHSSSLSDMRVILHGSMEKEDNAMTLVKDQTIQMLSALWIQANLADNFPINFEAIAHTFSLTLFFSNTKNQDITIRFFQLPLSLRACSLDFSGELPISRRKALFTLSTAMLLNAAKAYKIPELIDNLRQSLTDDMLDSSLDLSTDFCLVTKRNAEFKEYLADEYISVSPDSSDWLSIKNSHTDLIDNIAQSLSTIYGEDTAQMAIKLSEPFSLVDEFAFGPQLNLEPGFSHKSAYNKQALSFDEVLPANSSMDEDLVSESSVADLPRVPSQPTPKSSAHVISVGQLLESALEAAGQVASVAVPTAPISFSAMAGQCEAFGSSTRKKLSVWLNHETNSDAFKLALPDREESCSAASQNIGKIEEVAKSCYQHPNPLPREPWQAMRLPAASPYDNFLKAAGC